MSFLGGTGKSRSYTGPTAYAQRVFKDFQGSTGQEFMSQLGQYLRTGGIGAQTPIVAQSVGSAQSALSSALRDTQGQLAAQGLGRTPYASSIMGSQRLSGLQNIAAIPTNYAQQALAQIPGLYQAILGSVASSTTGRTGSYST